MTKQELAANVAAQTGLTRSQAMEAIEATIENIKTTVKKGGEVQLRGFGTFRAVLRKEKIARNITQQTTIVIPACKKPVFKASKEFSSAVAENK
jgi:DNA-binding protein HU-beta